MVVVTGRPAAEIVPLLGMNPTPEVWGLHGSEHLHADGRCELEMPPPAIRAQLNALYRRLRRDSFGGLVEKKTNALVMHWRGVSPAKANVIEARTRSLFEPLAQLDGLALLKFESGLELRAGRDKGEVVKVLLEETKGGGPHPTAYLGDDITDEKAFRALKGRGLGVLVRRERRDTAANVWLRPPEELREFLREWLRATLQVGSDRTPR